MSPIISVLFFFCLGFSHNCSAPLVYKNSLPQFLRIQTQFVFTSFNTFIHILSKSQISFGRRVRLDQVRESRAYRKQTYIYYVHFSNRKLYLFCHLQSGHNDEETLRLIYIYIFFKQVISHKRLCHPLQSSTSIRISTFDKRSFIYIFRVISSV